MASLSGFLAKKGDTGIVRSWKIRYFELKTEPAPALTFAESREAAAEGTIELSKVTGISVNDEILGKRRSEGNRGFQIDVPGHSYQLMATTDDELKHWLDGLEGFLPPGVQIKRDSEASSGGSATPSGSQSSSLPTNIASTPSFSTTPLSVTPSPISPQIDAVKTISTQTSSPNKTMPISTQSSAEPPQQRKESIAPPRPTKAPSEPSNNPFDKPASASPTASSKLPAETEAELKALRGQVAQLQAQLKTAQSETLALKDEKAKSHLVQTSSSHSVPSLSPRTSSSSLPPLESGEAESEESLAALMKLRDEVLAAMTELRVHGLGAARAFQSARAYRGEVEALRGKLSAKENESASSFLASANAPSPAPVLATTSPSISSNTALNNARKKSAGGAPSSTNPFA